MNGKCVVVAHGHIRVDNTTWLLVCKMLYSMAHSFMFVVHFIVWRLYIIVEFLYRIEIVNLVEGYCDCCCCLSLYRTQAHVVSLIRVSDIGLVSNDGDQRCRCFRPIKIKGLQAVTWCIELRTVPVPAHAVVLRYFVVIL